MDDNLIIALFFKRDEEAINQTKLKYEGFLDNIAFNILKVKEDSEECVSDTYLKAWNEIPPEKPKFLKYYLGRITRNLSVNLYKKNHAVKRYAGPELIFDELKECIPSPLSTENEVEVKELANFITSWLYSLKKEKRVLFIRRYWYCQEIKAIAALERKSPAKISKDLFNLRLSLKEALKKEGYFI